MSENPLVEQAKQGDVNAIASLMNRLLKSQGMLANIERSGDRLEILIESDLRSMDDEMRIPKRPVLVGMIKKWFVTIEVKTVSSLKISWQQTGAEEPAWTEEIFLVEPDTQQTEGNSISDTTENAMGNGGLSGTKARLTIPPLPVLPRRAMPEQSSPEQSISEQCISEQSSPEQSISEQSRDLVNSDRSATSPDLDVMFGEPNVSESLQSISVPEYLSSDLENPQPFQDPDVLWLADVSPPEMVNTAIDDKAVEELNQEFNQEVRNSEPEEISPAINPLSKILFQTPSIPIQFAQYVVVCAVIILALRGIHAALSTPKVPKATSAVSTQIK
ncbi:MAG: hypothetical protein WCP16_17640 [Pseudanabaena sp. ELA645]|jgi:hypothetical protein